MKQDNGFVYGNCTICGEHALVFDHTLPLCNDCDNFDEAWRACAVCGDFFDSSDLPTNPRNLRFPFQLITCFHCDPYDEILYNYDEDESVDDVS